MIFKYFINISTNTDILITIIILQLIFLKIYKYIYSIDISMESFLPSFNL